MARYAYTSAARLDEVERVRPQRQDDVRRDFSVVEGAGLDARVRAGVSSDFVGQLVNILMIFAFLIALGSIRVGLCSLAVSSLEGTMSIRSEIRSAEATSDELQIEHSVLSSTERIERIATQNYGMVPAEDTATITLLDEMVAEEVGPQTLALDTQSPVQELVTQEK